MPPETTSSLSKLYSDELRDLLALELGAAVEDRIHQSLLRPIGDLLERPKKNLRATLTELGFRFSGNTDPTDEGNLKIGLEVIEALHAGSLVVDDIEDGSAFRRGEPALHERYGVPVALNAGNWLYFWPLELIRRMKISDSSELAIYRLYHRTLLRAHFGQALDVGVEIDGVPSEKLYSTCLASLELKSGTLTAFALGLGSLIGGTSEVSHQAILRFGHRFGVALQMFDDIGNLLGKGDPQKRWEDLKLRRPTWIWASLADSPELTSFRVAAARLPEESPLLEWIAKNAQEVTKAKERAFHFLNESLSTFRAEMEMNPRSEELLQAVVERLKHAYD